MSKPTTKTNWIFNGEGPAGLAAGIVDGLSSFLHLWGTAASRRRRRYAPHGITSDWQSVGQDLHNAFSAYKVDEAS